MVNFLSFSLSKQIGGIDKDYGFYRNIVRDTALAIKADIRRGHISSAPYLSNSSKEPRDLKTLGWFGPLQSRASRSKLCAGNKYISCGWFVGAKN